MNDQTDTSTKRKRVNLDNCSRRDMLTRFAGAAGVGALAGALPVFAQDKESVANGGGQNVGTVKLTTEVRAAIKRGLNYLAKPGQQKEDGSWSGGAGITSLALMAFMVEGHVPGRGHYGDRMEAGIAYLIDASRKQRGIMADPAGKHVMYSHGLAVLALSEAWGQSRNPRIRTALLRGVDVILRAQNETGGWRYKPNSQDADISVTALQLVALMSAKEAGIVVPQKTVNLALKYILSLHVEKSGDFTYTAEGKPAIGRTAAAVTSLMLSGHGKHPAARRGVAAIKAQLKDVDWSLGPFFLWVHYYVIQALYQAGEAEFQTWYPKIASFLLANQQPDGSWRPHGGLATDIETSLAILILGVPYRYLPIYQR